MTQGNYDPTFMQRAVELSRIAYQSGKGLPIGCVIVRDGVIVGEGHNEAFARMNPTAHAEMTAIEDACRKQARLELSGCDLYTTLEPCPMCMAAVYWAKLRSVFFANSKEDAAAIVGFSDAFIQNELQRPPAQRLIQVTHVDNTEALRPFVEWKELGTSAQQPWPAEHIDR